MNNMASKQNLMRHSFNTLEPSSSQEQYILPRTQAQFIPSKGP
jgi:hypothetical protein